MLQTTYVLCCLDLNELRPESSSSTAESTSTSGQPSTPVRPCEPRSNVLTSTPNISIARGASDVQSPVQPICEGMFVGRAQHKDGSSLGLLFQVMPLLNVYLLMKKLHQLS